MFTRVATLSEIRDHGVDGCRARGLLPPMGGGAVGQGAAAFMQNFPSGQYITDQAFFNRETERNDAPASAIAYTGFGGTPMQSRIANVGLLAGVELMFVGTLVVTGALTTTYRFPQGMFRNINLSVNGQTGLMSANGLAYHVHGLRLYRNPDSPIVGTAGGVDSKGSPVAGSVIADGTYTVIFFIDLPIVHDMTSLAGLLFAQSDANEFEWTATPETFGNLFSAGAATLTGNFYQELTFFDIPVAPADGKNPGGPVVPPMNWIHGFLEQRTAVLSTGQNPVPLSKLSGQLLALYWMIDNGAGVQLSPQNAYDAVELQYGVNRNPRNYSGPTGLGALGLLRENQEDYNGPLGPQYLVLDFEKDSPDRDIVYPKGVTELQLLNTITAGATVDAGAYCYFTAETLYSAV
jgi:hypothetical protein